MFIYENSKLTWNRKESPDNFRLRIQFCSNFFFFNECAITLPCLDFSGGATFLERGNAVGLTDVPLSRWPDWSLPSLIFFFAVCSFIDGSFFTFGRNGACIQWVRSNWRFPKPWRCSGFCTFRNIISWSIMLLSNKIHKQYLRHILTIYAVPCFGVGDDPPSEELMLKASPIKIASTTIKWNTRSIRPICSTIRHIPRYWYRLSWKS